MIRTSFDAWAPAYDGSALQPAYRAAHAAVLHQVSRLTTCPHRVLDVGCGTGQLLRAAADAFPGTLLVGLDPSGGMLSIAGTAAPPTPRWVQAAAECLPFADHSFDLVVSTASFRHWSDPDAAMREICRVLTPGGLLGLADLIDPGRRGLVSYLARRVPLPPQYEASLAAAGLRTVGATTVDGFGPITAITVILAREPSTVR